VTVPSWLFKTPTRSGRAWGDVASWPILTDGAALIFEEAGTPEVFFLFSDVGTKAVASFFRSRNSGSAEIVALACTALESAASGGAVEGFGGNEGCPGGN